MLVKLSPFLLLLLVIAASPLTVAQEVPGCGSLTNILGPYDYYDPSARQELATVEANHFTPDVEALRKGKSDVNIIGDLEFVLRHFPNHPRALNSVARFAVLGGRFPPGQIPSADCYFQRAIAFRHEDATVRMVYANYLTKVGNRSEARKQYEEALRLAPASAEINYNAGLFFVDEGQLERARTLSKIAYQGGYPLPGLRRKIQAAEAKNER